MMDVDKEQERSLPVLLVSRTENRVLSDREVVAEISGLVTTAGMQPVDTVVLRRFDPAPKFGMGTGKAEEIMHVAESCGAEAIVFEFEITPTQQRNWETLTGLTCFDRQEVIIRIFADRAMTREAVLQIELARLKYSLPRLAHTYSALSRQRGGRYGTRGGGETQLELDRRSILKKITRIQGELKEVRKDRSTQRKQRERVSVPSCAIVGYTNAGKSTLLNALTGAAVLAEDKLFATLDPTTRRYDLPSGRKVLLTDTVGFVHDLPHTLIDAFRSTLEEASFATGVLIILDASDANIQLQYDTSLAVLEEIGARSRPELIVLNKADLLDEHTRARLPVEFPGSVLISARTGEGFDAFAQLLEALVSGSEQDYLLPLDRGDLVARLHREGTVSKVDYRDDGILIRAGTDGRIAALLREYEYHA